jgi:hypothetical protein
MPQQAIPTCCEADKFTPTQLFQFLYCLVYSINEAIGGGTASDKYTSSFTHATGNGTVPAGVLGWSVTAVSGTVTVQGQSLPTGATVRGGGYGGRTLTAAIAYTVAGPGVALVTYDVPA